MVNLCLNALCLSLSDLANIAQSVAVVLGVGFFLVEYRRRTIELGHATYVSTANAYIDLEKEMIANQTLRKIYDYSDMYRELPDAAKRRQHFFYALLMVFEIVFLSKKWMDRNEWQGWTAWMSEMMRNSDEFRMALNDNLDLYAKPFVEFLRGGLSK